MRAVSFVLCFVLCLYSVSADDPIEKTEFPINWKDLRWLDDTVSILLTNDGRVYRSTDTGIHYQEITNLLSGASQFGNKPAFLYTHDVDHNKIYVRGESTTSWISNDKGSTWRVVHPDKVFRNLDWHPKHPDWAIAQFNSELWVTRDFGETWKIVKPNVYRNYYSWGDAGTGEIPKERIYYIASDQTTNNQYQNVIYTDDFGGTEHIALPRGVAFLFLDKQLFILARLPEPLYNEFVLKVTPDLGRKSKHYFEAEFPFGDQLEYNGYTILDDETGAVFLGVNHGDLYSRWGNIYVSEARGWQYATSMKHASMVNSYYDFGRVYGLEGIYIANTLENWEDADSRPYTTDRITTYMSHDNGGSWNRVSAPHFDSTGQPISCTGKCSLHLHGFTSLMTDSFGPFYSTENSLGLIVATGNIGEHLDLKVENANTYLSRDAGLTWVEVVKGSTIYEIGDHGSIIVFAPFDRSTTTLYYTLDEGTTVQSFAFSSQPVDVENIITEPSSTNERFIVQAVYPSTGETVLFGIDFSKVFSRACVESDYETWAPDAGKTEVNNLKCLMGRDVTYRRRRADAKCFNGDLERVVQNISCPCIADDYECDYLYERASDNTCVLPPNTYPPTFPPDYCPPGTSYYRSKGYRKETGNTCQGGVDMNGDGPFPCPPNGNAGDTGSADSSSSGFDIDKAKKSKGWIAAVILVPVVFILLIGAVVALRSERLREKLPFLAFLTSWKDGYMQTVDTVDEDQFIEEEEIEEDAYTIGDDDHHHTTQLTTTTTANTSAPATTIVDFDEFDPRK